MLLLLFISSIYAVEPLPVKVNISSECGLNNPKITHYVDEISLFKLTIEEEILPSNSETVKEISLWADGKTYPINNGEAYKSRWLSTDDIKSINNAKFLKLSVKYTNHINEEQSSKGGTTPYYTAIKTTVEKEQYLPILIKQSTINNAMLDCRKSIDEQKMKFSLLKFFIAIGVIIGLIGLLLIFKRVRRDK